MAEPTVRRTFDLMGIFHRVDIYAHAGDVLPMHQHDEFDHGIVVVRGRIRVTTPSGDHLMGALDSAIFRKGRPHQIEALDDDTVVISEMPGVISRDSY